VENSLKQRIIGAIVLIALAIIFLPTILKEKISNGTFKSQIPAKPTELENYRINTQKIDELMASDIAAKVEPQDENSNQANAEINNGNLSKPKSSQPDPRADQLNNPDEIKSKQAKASSKKVKVQSVDAEIHEKTKISERFTDAAWVVQVASFAKEANAVNLTKKLQDKKYKAYRRKVLADGQTVFRVFVGPYIHRKDAEKVVSKISKLSESSAMLKPFDPVEH